MRPFKFRAMNKETKQMIYFGFSDIYEGGLVLLRTDGRIDPNKQIDLTSNETEIMQFTGFVDINKKEIYEGDKVSYKGFYSGGSWNERGEGIVKWDKGGEWVIFSKSGKFFISDLWEMVYNYGLEVI